MKVASFLIGQSNERGNCHVYEDGATSTTVCVSKRAEYGPPNESLTTYWPYCTEKLWQTDSKYMRVWNETAVSGTSIVVDWCGTAGLEPYTKDDVGFDPNSYFADIKTEIDALPANGYDEVWVFISIGNNDSSIATTRANFGQAYINAVEWCLANGVDKVFLGLSPPSKNVDIATSYQRYQDNLDPGVQDALANYSTNLNVMEGANAWRLFKGNTGVLFDNNHIDQNATIRVGREWAKVISNSLAGNASAYY